METAFGTPLTATIGTLVLGLGAVRLGGAVHRIFRGDSAALAYTTGLRTAFLGFGVTGAGIAWFLGEAWLLTLALGIAAEEVLEASVVLTGLRAQVREDG